ncbi:hypothetical protein [Streptomyces mangrovisoli]|uniref:Uncharacterized protein n=1 Tax=Streptomyces mangrovisoli TaxID=1428628 RepID=A0A1J4NNR4_9ACTN|nr:hypothetical protein [Streptomyces mangrovisoli]OIJ63999.1 hypothetical protein WN71_031955 [Streptomyces mangrovisoli]
MIVRGRRVRWVVVSAMVVLALTGFSSGRGHSGRSRHSGVGSGSGGGCSNSRQDHDSSSSASGGGGSSGGDSYEGSTSRPYDDTPSRSSDGYDSGSGSGASTGGGSAATRTRPTHRATPTASPSGGTARPLDDGSAVLVHCASVADPYATVVVENPNGRKGTFTVSVTFQDSHGRTLTTGTGRALVPAQDDTTIRVAVTATADVERISHCVVAPKATAER